MSFDPLFVYGNYLEACFWAVLAVVAYVKRKSRASAFLAVSLLAFGISDVVETITGAWYQPWWLLVWKVGCVLAIVGSGIAVYRRRR